MSQKKSKLLKKFLNKTGLITKCDRWFDDKGKEHMTTAEHQAKAQYKSLNYKDKTRMSKELK